jgi:hypothetical protein
MSKNGNGNGNGNMNSETDGHEEETEKKEKVKRPDFGKVPAAERKKMFAAWSEADAKVTKAKAALDAATIAREKACEIIWEAGGAGTFAFEGRNLVMMATKDGKHFFRCDSKEAQLIA